MKTILFLCFGFTVLFAQASDTPSYVSPPNGDNLMNPLRASFWWTWHIADTYQVNISDSAGNRITRHVFGCLDTGPIALKPRTKYYWVITDLDHQVSSVVHYFTTAMYRSPYLIAPDDNAMILSDTVILKWSKLAPATNYEIEIGTMPNSIVVKIDTTVQTDTTITITNLANNKYWWTVRAYTNIYGWTSWSLNTRWFTVNVPTVSVLSHVSAKVNKTVSPNVKYFDIQGRVVTIPSLSNIYIKQTGNTVSKEVLWNCSRKTSR